MSDDYSVSVYERPGSPCWWARCYLAGELGAERRWSTKVRVDAEGGRRGSRRMAQRRAEERASALADEVDTAAAASSSTSLAAVAQRMLRQKIADGRRPRAVEALAHNLDKHVLPFFGAARDIATLRRSDLEALKRHLVDIPRSAVTVNNCLTAIRQTLKYAHAVEELLEVTPNTPNVRVSQQGKGRALTPEQVVALLNALNSREIEARQYLGFIANTGLRKSETLAMRWDWVDWARRELHIPAEYRKGAQARAVAVPLNASAMQILIERRDYGTKYTGSRKGPLPTGPDDRVWLQRKHDASRNAAAERAGLGRVRTHDLRHTRGSLLHAAGASLPEVRDVLGHRTLAMVSRYAHSYGERLHEVSERVELGQVRRP